MYRKTPRIRKVGVAALVAATALSGFVFAPPAGAAPITEANLDIDELSSPSIGVGKTNQAAGPLRITHTATSTDTLTSGDQILISAADNDGNDCATTSTVEFASVPTVSLTGTATYVATIESSSPACALAGITDVVRLNVTGSGTATAINLTNVLYNVGATAATGPVAVVGSFDPAGGAAVAAPFGADSTASNAFVTTALMTANNPPKGADQVGGGSYAISPVVITEQNAAGADGDLCVYFSDNIEDTPAPAPTVAVTGGTDTATLTTSTANDSVFVNVTPSAPTSTSTFTISGIRLETDFTGVKTATVYADNDDDVCDGDEVTQLSDGDTNVGYVGNVDRFGGSDRFTTAQILFEDMFGCGADNVIIARADQYPDALAASYLAGASGTGILLTNTNSVPAATLNALRSEGVDNVYLMGGTQAISTAVENQLDNRQAYNDCGGSARTNGFGAPITLNVERIGGVDRYETAQLISEFPGLSNAGFADVNGDADCGETAKTAIVTSGENFPDALAAGPLAYSGDDNCAGGELPLLLSRTSSVPSATLGALNNLGITNVILVGGTAAVSDAAAAQMTAAGYNVRRIAGVNRQATAVALATAMMNEWSYDDDDVNIARGDDFADALTGGPYSGSEGDVIVLTGSPTSLSSETSSMFSNWETLYGDELDQLDIFGGTAAVSAAVVQAALDAASQQ